MARHVQPLGLWANQTLREYPPACFIEDAEGPLTSWAGIPWADVYDWVDAFLQNPRRELEGFGPPVPITEEQIARYREQVARSRQRQAALDARIWAPAVDPKTGPGRPR